MKTEDLIQMAALAAIGYLLWQRTTAGKSPATKPTTSTLPTTIPVDFGDTNASDPSWGDSSGGIGFVQALIGDVT